MFLPTPPGTCPVCAVEHSPEEPHWMSFYYIYRFYYDHGRVPIWEDTMGHCRPEMREEWVDKLRAGGVAIKTEDDIEAKLWQVIMDHYGYDEDNCLFLEEIKRRGALNWAAEKIRHLESDLAHMRHIINIPIWNSTIRDATIIRRVLEVLTTGHDRGRYLGPGDARLRVIEKKLASN